VLQAPTIERVESQRQEGDDPLFELAVGAFEGVASVLW